MSGMLGNTPLPGQSPCRKRLRTRYFDVALYLLVLTGFGTLASTGTLDLPGLWRR